MTHDDGGKKRKSNKSFDFLSFYKLKNFWLIFEIMQLTGLIQFSAVVHIDTLWNV